MFAAAVSLRQCMTLDAWNAQFALIRRIAKSSWDGMGNLPEFRSETRSVTGAATGQMQSCRSLRTIETDLKATPLTNDRGEPLRS